MATYVVATKREARSEGVSAVDRVRDITGVTVTGTGSHDRIVIEASPEAASELERQLGDKLLVEPEILHQPLSNQAE